MPDFDVKQGVRVAEGRKRDAASSVAEERDVIEVVDIGSFVRRFCTDDAFADRVGMPCAIIGGIGAVIVKTFLM